MSSFPHLIDIGIMGSCKTGLLGLCSKSGIYCYQRGGEISKPDMRYDDFERICKECKGKTLQFALGGRGDPDTHPDFEKFLKCCFKYNITPSFTTSGLFMNDTKAKICKKYCGAVAVSWHNADYTTKAIQALINNNVKTNIHFVLNKNSITLAINLLKKNLFPKEINAIIFLLHKPSATESQDICILRDDKNINEFFELIKEHSYAYKIGFDSCTVPAIINNMDFNPISIEACEAARFSCYIDSDLEMMPCSFDIEKKYATSIMNSTIQSVWNGKVFEEYREFAKESCPNCKNKKICLGGCHLYDNINLCKGST
jgi:radical SAM protein with 4Fe4S-binding SPASM domain